MSATVHGGVRASILRSALSEAGKFKSTEHAHSWLKSTATERAQAVKEIPFDELVHWSFEPESGDLIHSSGKFFRVTGVHVKTDLGPMAEWEQPIIDQPEIGILGILAREVDGVLYLLMQAKMEPGNPLGVQLTPTVQATRSNYTQVHQGARPLYLDYFVDRGRGRVIVDQLQWEHGSAFVRKRNRNVVILLDGEVPLHEGFDWLTLGQVKKLLSIPNLVSMDARTVIACLPLVDNRRSDWQSAGDAAGFTDFSAAVLKSFGSEQASSPDEEVQSWLTDLKSRHHLVLERVGLSRLRGWSRTDREIVHQKEAFFKIVAVDVRSASREVAHWTQPMIAPVEQGLIAFVTTEVDGVLHVLLKARAEPGCADTLILGPSVQSALGFERTSEEGEHPDVVELVRNASGNELQFACVQSEEGGRFYGVQSEYRIVQTEGGDALRLPPNYRWLSFRQVQELVRYGLVSVEARSLLSCLAFT